MMTQACAAEWVGSLSSAGGQDDACAPCEASERNLDDEISRRVRGSGYAASTHERTGLHKRLAKHAQPDAQRVLRDSLAEMARSDAYGVISRELTLRE